MKKSSVVFAFVAFLFFTACDKNNHPEDQYTIRLLKEYEYEKARFFFLDTCYRNQFEVYSNRIHTYQTDKEISDIKLYFHGPNSDTSSHSKPCVAVLGDNSYFGQFEELWCLFDYSFYPKLGIISLNEPLQSGEVLAVFYQTHNGTTFGNIMGDTLQLKLIRTPNPRPTDATWNLEMKNIYDFGNINLSDKEAESFKITFTLPVSSVTAISDRNGVKQNLLRLLHLDVTSSNGSGPDGKADIGGLFNYGIDMDNGLFVFPKLRPFDPDNINLNGFFEEAYPDSFSGQSVRMKDVYDLERTNPNLQNMMNNSLFTLSMKIYQP